MLQIQLAVLSSRSKQTPDLPILAQILLRQVTGRVATRSTHFFSLRDTSMVQRGKLTLDPRISSSRGGPFTTQPPGCTKPALSVTPCALKHNRGARKIPISSVRQGCALLWAGQSQSRHPLTPCPGRTASGQPLPLSALLLVTLCHV